MQWKRPVKRGFGLVIALFTLLITTSTSHASEAKLRIPREITDASAVSFFGMSGHQLLLMGLVVPVLGLLFGLLIYAKLKKMPVHRTMLEVSELIYETCKTYLITQGKFLRDALAVHRGGDLRLLQISWPNIRPAR